MVWVPDAIVSDFCTRDSEPDASNRARHHCNACSQIFPLGSVAQMRNHLVACPSLSSTTIDSIKERIQDELTTPKRVTRDPRWTKAEETTLLRLDDQLPSGKADGKYQKMAASIGRSAQACRQKLIHLKENQAVKNGEQETTKRVLWNRKTRSSKIKTEPDDEEEFMPTAYEEIAPAKTIRRGSRKVRFQQEMKIESSSPESRPGRSFSNSDAPISDPNSPTYRTTSAAARAGSTMSASTEEFLRLVRWHIHDALTNFRIIRGFYTSNLSIESGWGAFVASDIPHAEKDTIVARLIGLWLDGLDTDGFEREVDAKIETVVVEMSEWPFEGGNPMMKAIEELPTYEEDSGYEADGSYEDDAGHDAMEL